MDIYFGPYAFIFPEISIPFLLKIFTCCFFYHLEQMYNRKRQFFKLAVTSFIICHLSPEITSVIQ